MERAYFDALQEATDFYHAAKVNADQNIKRGKLELAAVYIEMMEETSEKIVALQEAIKRLPPARARAPRKMARRRPKENLKPKNYSRWQ